MKERPILMSVEMVRATLREIDPKTMTRRVVKPQAHHYVGDLLGQAFFYACDEVGFGAQKIKCPYGQIGDRLWVREAWKTGSHLDRFNATEIQYQAEDAGYFGKKTKCPIFYPADNRHSKWGENDISDFGEWGRHRHGRFMPRWASRILLEITNIRVERIQDISEDDAKKEGFSDDDSSIIRFGNARNWFLELWDRIKGKKSPSFGNPWVWVIEFKRINP
jgi:hypothetical protein